MTSIEEVSQFHSVCLFIDFPFLPYSILLNRNRSSGLLSVDLRYISRMVKEHKQNMTVIFLEKRACGYFQLKRTQEEVEKWQVFMQEVVVNWKGVDHFEVSQEKELQKHHAYFWKTSRFKREGTAYINTRAWKISSITVVPINSRCSLTHHHFYSNEETLGNLSKSKFCFILWPPSINIKLTLKRNTRELKKTTSFQDFQNWYAK